MPTDTYENFRKALKAKQQEKPKGGPIIKVRIDGKVIMMEKPVIALEKNVQPTKRFRLPW